MTFHYARWVQTPTIRNGVPEVILELAFWIGPTPGTVPTAEMLEIYGDIGDTAHTDLWVIFHLHIPRDASTFPSLSSTQRNFFPGVRAMGVYHSQTLHYVGDDADPRAEFEFADTYAGGGYNTGTMTNYNTRTQTLQCRDNGRWYIGRDSVTAIQAAQRQNANLPAQYVTALNAFVSWLTIFSDINFILYSY